MKPVDMYGGSGGGGGVTTLFYLLLNMFKIFHNKKFKRHGGKTFPREKKSLSLNFSEWFKKIRASSSLILTIT